MSQRFYNPAPVFADLLGLEPLAGGSLQFYDKGTTTPKGTWSDSDLTVANQNPVPLDSSGRANTNIWLDGAYTVVLRAADGTSVWTRDVDDGATGGATIPTLQNGQFLTNDGSNVLWSEILQVPDPTGSSGKVLGTDGSNLIWEAKQVIPELDVVLSSASLMLGTSSSTTKFYVQKGSSSAPASGGRTTSASVSFPRAFKEIWSAVVTQRHGGVTAFSTIPQQSNSDQSTAGFTVKFSTDENSTAAGWNITSPVPFDWIAFGTVEEAA